MRDKFFKWLKRFFIVLPIIFLLINLSIYVLRQNGENLQLQSQEQMLQDDFIGFYLYKCFDGDLNTTSLNAYNPLFNFNFNEDYIINNNSIMYNVSTAFNNLFTILIGDNNYDTTSVYVPLLSNFLTWWVFIELIFLFFRFITFLISWVNSLFDKCFNKINKG